MRYLSRLILLFAGLLPAHAAQADILVAAASSVREPLDRIAASFERDSGLRVSVSYGSSGNLAHQVLRGAPYQVFLSADTDYPERIWRDGRDLERPRLYARGSLRIYAN